MTEFALRPGVQLASTGCATRVVVIRAPQDTAAQIACGGAPLALAATVPESKHDETPAVTLIGKRYVDAAETIELLCTSSGAGELTCDGVPLTVKAAKALPASD